MLELSVDVQDKTNGRLGRVVCLSRPDKTCIVAYAEGVPATSGWVPMKQFKLLPPPKE
jgi:hypothetical protein